MTHWIQDTLFSQTSLYAVLKQNPLGFIDIGARGGIHPLVKPIANVTAVLCVDADEEECRRLRADTTLQETWAEFVVEPVALSNQTGEATLYRTTAETNDSLFAPDPKVVDRYGMHRWTVTQTQSLCTETLDRFLGTLQDTSILWGELIKLDTQGTEFEILQGAKRTLDEHTVALMTEVEFFPVYQGQKLFSDLEILLRESGFSFYGFSNTQFRSGKRLDKQQAIGRERIFYADAFFFKDPLAGGNLKKDLSPRQLKILVCCAALVGYYDYAIELLPLLRMKKEEEQLLESFVLQLAHHPVQKAYESVQELVQEISRNPENANVTIGKFVDRRRDFFPYHDIS